MANKAYVPASNAVDKYYGSVSNDYVKPNISYIEYLYSKSERISIYEYNISASGINNVYTVPIGKTLFITHISMSSIIGANPDLSFLDIGINRLSSSFAVLKVFNGSSFNMVNTGREFNMSFTLPIKVNSSEIISRQLISMMNLTAYEYQIHGFLVDNKYLLV